LNWDGIGLMVLLFVPALLPVFNVPPDNSGAARRTGERRTTCPEHHPEIAVFRGKKGVAQVHSSM
jgi:hypothetical protein